MREVLGGVKDAIWSLLPRGASSTSVVSAIAIFLALLVLWVFVRRRRQPSEAASGQVLVIVSDAKFELPAVAAVVGVLQNARIGFTITTRSGGRVAPDEDSLQTAAAKAAEKRRDAAWLAVLNSTGSTIPFARCARTPSRWRAVFVAGGRHTLRELRRSEMDGSHSLTPFCLDVRNLCSLVLEAGGTVGATGHGVHGLPVGATDRCFSGKLDSAAEAIARAMVASLPEFVRKQK
jgi:hypothetical protein